VGWVHSRVGHALAPAVADGARSARSAPRLALTRVDGPSRSTDNTALMRSLPACVRGSMWLPVRRSSLVSVPSANQSGRSAAAQTPTLFVQALNGVQMPCSGIEDYRPDTGGAVREIDRAIEEGPKAGIKVAACAL
jgi:hypothetical protein